jgi:6-phosphogluconolactonase
MEQGFHEFRTEADFAHHAVDLIVNVLKRAAADRKDNAAYLALAGGSTPAPVYELLAKQGEHMGAPFATTRIFFSDDRCVPLDNPDSNVGMARRTLLDHAPIDWDHVHAPAGGDVDPQTAADAYEARIRELVPPGDDGLPRFDLILLGMGADGHTASLFPGRPTLEETQRLVVVEPEPGQPPRHARITFTLPLINAAAAVCFLVGEEGKEPVLDAIRSGQKETPAGRVAPRGELYWYLKK